ncbi:MAG: sugar transferase, partial [Gemmatimonadales bacterium]
MEALLERANGGIGRTEQDPWSDDGEDSPDAAPLTEAVGLEWPNRTLNFVLAVLALIALLPVFLLLAVLIKLTSRGPVFYLQERVGLDRRLPGPGPHNHRRRHDFGGRVFTIYKFRTMRVDAEVGGAAVWAQEQDPRVTPLG